MLIQGGHHPRRQKRLGRCNFVAGDGRDGEEYPQRKFVNGMRACLPGGCVATGSISRSANAWNVVMDIAWRVASGQALSTCRLVITRSAVRLKHSCNAETPFKATYATVIPGRCAVTPDGHWFASKQGISCYGHHDLRSPGSGLRIPLDT